MKSTLQRTIYFATMMLLTVLAQSALAAPPGGVARNDRNNWSAPTIQEHWAKTGVGMQGRHRVHKSLPGARGQEQYEPVSPGAAMQKAIPELVPCDELGGDQDGTKGPGDCQWYYEGVIPANKVKIPTPSRGSAAQIRANSVRGLTGKRITDTAAYAALAAVSADEVSNLLNPETQARIAQASMQAQDTNTGNAFAEVTHNQSTSAIEYCATYLTNFTVDGGNRWNKLRDTIFVPIALLLILPGAVLTQVKAIASCNNPVLGQMNPLEGILRSIVAIFLIPATYLVINYGIDLSNALTYAIDSEYTRQFGSDMYKDAICAQIRAFPSRQPAENRNAYDLPTAAMGEVMMGKQTPFARLEATLYANKIEDPCAGVYIVPQDRADEALPSSAVAARLAMLASNMALTTSWNVLCAFQMAYLYYLWCVGPIAAALYVWPMKQLRDALPSWIEGALTLCFWSLFWNTTILLMACFRGVDETGTVIMSALNFLATACVKSAFDFSGLIRAAGAQASSMAEQAMKAAKGGGGASGGGRGSTNRNNNNGNGNGNQNNPNTEGPTVPNTNPGVSAPGGSANPNTTNQMPPMLPAPTTATNPAKTPDLWNAPDVSPPPLADPEETPQPSQNPDDDEVPRKIPAPNTPDKPDPNAPPSATPREQAPAPAFLPPPPLAMPAKQPGAQPASQTPRNEDQKPERDLTREQTRQTNDHRKAPDAKPVSDNSPFTFPNPAARELSAPEFKPSMMPVSAPPHSAPQTRAQAEARQATSAQPQQQTANGEAPPVSTTNPQETTAQLPPISPTLSRSLADTPHQALMITASAPPVEAPAVQTIRPAIMEQPAAKPTQMFPNANQQANVSGLLIS